MAADAAGQPSPASRWYRRTEAQVLDDQLEALAAWTEALHGRVLDRGPCTRESRVDLRRREDVLAREHEAVLACTARQMERSGLGSGASAPLRVVLAHRDDWYADRLTRALDDGGVHVVARTPNGAEAVGITVAEQPDVLVLEERLEMLPGAEVLRRALALAPTTLAVAQAVSRESAPVLVAAGADVVCARSTPPGELATEVCALLAVDGRTGRAPR